MPNECRQENCTVAETGTCLLNNDPATCPNRASEVDESRPVETVVELVPAGLLALFRRRARQTEESVATGERIP